MRVALSCSTAYPPTIPRSNPHFFAIQAEGAYTAVGTWAASAEEAKLIEELADADEKWDALLKERAEWLNPPTQPAGLQNGAQCAVAVYCAAVCIVSLPQM